MTAAAEAAGPAGDAEPAGQAGSAGLRGEPGRFLLRDRIDSYPTRRIAGYGVRAGRPLPMGATLVSGGVNFAVYSDHATALTLVLYRRGQREPVAELPIPPEFRLGSVYAITVYGLEYDMLEYGYRADGPWEPAAGHRFDPGRVLADPYARLVCGREEWGRRPDWDNPYQYRSRLLFDDFDWGSDRPLRRPAEELVIYELHVRGFTRHPSSGVSAPGTFAGLAEKAGYLAELGVTAVELMPVFEFDEHIGIPLDADTGTQRCNYWGYGTHSFFAPKAGYALTARYGLQADEFKALVKTMHRAGIEVILDVVFNHTAEGDGSGPVISFRGLDNATWYMLTADGEYQNFSGTGNTLDCNHPVVRGFVLDCLRYWAAEFHVDGFRFDLASILSRGQDGTPLPDPPLVESIAYDPVLRHCKLIAEAWDACGLYDVGRFPAYDRWMEWNGRYRDTIRRFVKGDAGVAGDAAGCLVGSPELYAGRGPLASVNFVAVHDGFTLADLVSYNDKHNEDNGEGNRDGTDDNASWNCGAEGESDDPEVTALRRRQVRNLLALLLVSHGVPMLQAGDEVGRTQRGNNNAYCHDSELSWMDWTLAERNADLLQFTRNLIAFRGRHPALRPRQHPVAVAETEAGGESVEPVEPAPSVDWYGTAAGPDWSAESRLLAVTHTAAGDDPDRVLVVANMHWEPAEVALPAAREQWYVAVNTASAPPADCYPAGAEPPLAEAVAAGREPGSVLVEPRSVLVLTDRPGRDGLEETG